MQHRKRPQKERVKAKVKKRGIPHIPCPECGAGTHVGSAGEVYKHTIPGRIRELLICNRYPACDTYVAINSKQKRYGLPANRKVRRLRSIAHVLQDKIIKNDISSRDALYEQMSLYYGLRLSRAHIRYFDERMCRKVIRDYRRMLAAHQKVGEDRICAKELL